MDRGHLEFRSNRFRRRQLRVRSCNSKNVSAGLGENGRLDHACSSKECSAYLKCNLEVGATSSVAGKYFVHCAVAMQTLNNGIS